MSIFTAERQRQQDAEHRRRRAEVFRQLDAVDQATMRPLRAVQAGTDTQADRDRLAGLETEAQTLRDQLATIPDPGPEA